VLDGRGRGADWGFEVAKKMFFGGRSGDNDIELPRCHAGSSRAISVPLHFAAF
jgi:hypothetical protein